MPQALTLSPVIRNYGINLGAPCRAFTPLHQNQALESRLSLRGQPSVRNLYCVGVCGEGGGSELL